MKGIIQQITDALEAKDIQVISVWADPPTEDMTTVILTIRIPSKDQPPAGMDKANKEAVNEE